MAILAACLMLLVISGLGTTLVAGAAAIMLTSEMADTSISAYDEQSISEDISPQVNASFYAPTFSDTKPIILGHVESAQPSARVHMGRIEMSSLPGGLSAESLGDFVATSAKKADVVGRVIRRRSIFAEEGHRLSIRC